MAPLLGVCPFGIRKDAIDFKKAAIELDKLQDEEKTRKSDIEIANFEQIKHFDPKYKKITDSSGTNRMAAPDRIQIGIETHSKFRSLINLIYIAIGIYMFSVFIKWLYKVISQ